MAGLSCTEHLLRIIFFIFNFGFWGIGAILIGVAVWCLVSVSAYDEFDISYVTNVSGILIAAGVVIFVLGFLGCAGSWKKNHWMLYTYAFLIAVIFILQLAGAIYAFKHKEEAKGVLQDSMEKSQAQYQVDQQGDPATKKAWDRLQRDFECCGTTGPTSWEERLGNDTVTDSCCLTEVAGCGANYDANDVYLKGCLDSVLEVVEEDLLAMGLMALIFGMVQWFGVVVACCLGNAFRDSGYNNIE